MFKLKYAASVSLAAFMIVLGLSAARAEEVDDNANSAADNAHYTTDYSYAHGIKPDPGDHSAESLNSREAEKVKSTTEVIYNRKVTYRTVPVEPGSGDNYDNGTNIPAPR